jgi:D-alanyl-D-alanine carboxypeptidase
MQGYGFANLEHEVPATPDTVFELASLTKQFTATAILLLAEGGKLGLDDPVAKHVKGAPETWKGITIRHLLTHTSGLPGMRDGFKSLWAKGWLVNYETSELFDAATKDALLGAPGSTWEYSDVGYFLLGLVIEGASGQKYRDFLADRFWKPLGMTSTSHLDQWKILKHRAAGYTIRNGEVVNIRRVSQTDLASHYGLFSSAKDMATWEIALAAGKVLNPASLAQLWTAGRLASGFPVLYGFGWFLDDRRGHRVLSHTGLTGTEYSRYPDEKLSVIVLTNLGQWLGPETAAANPWGLTHGVAGRYEPGLLLSTVAQQPDPRPAATKEIADMLAAVARGEDSELMLPYLRTLVRPAREVFANRLKTQQSFTLIACDELPSGATGRRGHPIARRCYYKAVNATETRYYTMWITADGKVADLVSTVD